MAKTYLISQIKDEHRVREVVPTIVPPASSDLQVSLQLVQVTEPHF